MRWKHKDPRRWRPFFLLFPRLIDDHWVWLETVEARRETVGFGAFSWWVFRMPGEPDMIEQLKADLTPPGPE